MQNSHSKFEELRKRKGQATADTGTANVSDSTASESKPPEATQQTITTPEDDTLQKKVCCLSFLCQLQFRYQS